MELGEHELNEPPVADCDCRRCAVATRDALRKDAERYRFIRNSTPEQFDQFEPGLYCGGDELDELTDAAMAGANA